MSKWRNKQTTDKLKKNPSKIIQPFDKKNCGHERRFKTLSQLTHQNTPIPRFIRVQSECGIYIYIKNTKYIHIPVRE